jgi:HD domain
MRDILLISRAWHFAAQRHSKQRRKGKAHEPYVNHLAEVAELVATATEGQDANLVAAAVLHDTVEDTARRALLRPLLRAFLSIVEILRGIDQGDVRQGLREIAGLAPGIRVVLLRK